jgi:hypothetical protein
MNQDIIPTAEPVTPPPAPVAAGASGRAIASLILGILSLVCMGFLTGIPAIILGSMELKAIKANRAPLAGEGVAKVGYILGIVGTALTCLAALAFVALLALGISVGAFSEIANSV